MKVFISHSTSDKWAARRISDDIEALGFKTFLDEKDITTGESIDASVQKHLKDCDDFLVLLSPASAKSDWVLVELGGALALSKQLVPILLYLGANDIPRPISKHLARDINDIDRYYAELTKRASKPTVPTRKPILKKRFLKPIPLRRDTFKPGDTVVLPTTQQPSAERDGVRISWADEMNAFLGQRGKVVTIDTDRSAKVDVDGQKFYWAFEWLRHAPIA